MKHTHLTKFRKLLAITTLLLLIASLTACWNKDDTGSTEGDTNPPPSSTEATTEATTEAPTVETTEAPTEAPTEPTQTEPAKQGTMGTITARELNIREEAGSKYDSVGSYFKGDRVEILEIKGQWGRTDKGWISLNYVKLDPETGDNKEPEETKPTDTDQEIESDGNKSAIGHGVVTLGALNVRTGPGTKYEDIGNVTLGQRYAYYQKSGNWVRIEDGWVSVSYFYIEGTTGEGAGTGTVTGADLNVRSGPGKDHDRVGGLDKGDTVKILAQVNGWGYTGKGWVSMNYITMEGADNAGAATTGVITGSGLNIRKEPGTDAEVVGSYDKGDKVEILEVKGNWGRTDKGWISLTYVKMDASTGTGVITGSGLNIRKEPGTDAEVVGSYDKGDKVEILEIKGNWGRTDKGWISLTYVKMDG